MGEDFPNNTPFNFSIHTFVHFLSIFPEIFPQVKRKPKSCHWHFYTAQYAGYARFRAGNLVLSSFCISQADYQPTRPAKQSISQPASQPRERLLFLLHQPSRLSAKTTAVSCLVFFSYFISQICTKTCKDLYALNAIWSCHTSILIFLYLSVAQNCIIWNSNCVTRPKIKFFFILSFSLFRVLCWRVPWNYSMFKYYCYWTA